MSVESVVEACVYLVTTTYTIKTTADRVISPPVHVTPRVQPGLVKPNKLVGHASSLAS
ncbi:MAG: hypothetical protein ABIR57_08250 [Aeromicrobium sp.]